MSDHTESAKPAAQGATQSTSKSMTQSATQSPTRSPTEPPTHPDVPSIETTASKTTASVAPQPVAWKSFAPFYAHLGLQVEALSGGTSRIRLPARQEISNSRGDAHGGAISGLFDALLSQAVRSAYDEPIGGLATIGLTVNFLSAGSGDLIGIGKAIRPGRTIAYAEGEVTTLDGEVVARASATYRVISVKPKRDAK